MTGTFTAGAVVMTLLLAAAPAAAHHSFAAEYDANKPITLKGTVVEMKWSSPHGALFIDVKRPDGKVVRWNIEFGAPSSLARRGWKKTDLPIGETVTVEAFLAKDGSPTANANAVTLSDGRQLFAGSAGAGAPEPAAAGRPRQ